MVQGLRRAVLIAHALVFDVVGFSRRTAALAHEVVIVMVQLSTVLKTFVFPFLVVLQISLAAVLITEVAAGNVKGLVRSVAAIAANFFVPFVESSLWTVAETHLCVFFPVV